MATRLIALNVKMHMLLSNNHPIKNWMLIITVNLKIRSRLITDKVGT